MSNLLASLLNSSNSLDVFGRALTVTQNNVSNASAPGYARQVQLLESVSFDPGASAQGGVRLGSMQSARDQYAEAAVWRTSADVGKTTQLTQSLQSVEGLFDVSGETGTSGALSSLIQSFSAWTINPNGS